MDHAHYRAHSVCTHCHARKVKCDLEHSRDNVCSNCRRFNQSCIKRTGIRKRQKVAGKEPSYQRSTKSGSVDEAPEDEALVSHPGVPRIVHSVIQRLRTNEQTEPLNDNAFIANSSVLSFDERTLPTVSESSISCSSQVRDAILSATGALTLPAPPLQRALTDAFFEQVYHDYPVVELEDISASDSSILLQQGVFLAGSLMRRDSDSLKLSQSLYEKIKTLIYLNYEPDSISILKTLCLLSCWSVKPPDKMSLDGPWHWTGVASRIALEMGLHQESTYINNPFASSLRKIFWHLYTADKLQVACWGRPPTFCSTYTDVKLPSPMDFRNQSMHGTIFIQTTKLFIIMGQISELQLEKAPINPGKLSQLTKAMCEWVREVPSELHLHDAAGTRKKFSRPVSELFIRYFTTIILLQRLSNGIDPQRHTSIQCLVASSCIINLYEEILFREQACFLLPINGFLCMVASIPQIYYKPRSAEKEATRQNEIKILCSVMKQMQWKFGGSEMVLRKIFKLQRQVDAFIEERPLAGGIETPGRITNDPCDYLEELFPFPVSMCSHMELIQRTGGLEEYSAQSFLSMESLWTPWLLTENLDLMDSLVMYPEMSNIT